MVVVANVLGPGYSASASASGTTGQAWLAGDRSWFDGLTTNGTTTPSLFTGEFFAGCVLGFLDDKPTFVHDLGGFLQDDFQE